MPRKLWKCFPLWAAILTLPAYAANAFLIASKGSSEAGLLKSGVTGHTYTTNSSGTFETRGDCGKIVADLNHELIDKTLFESHFVYDYVFACLPTENEDETFIVVDLTIEPSDESSIDVLEKYREAHQGRFIHKQRIDFRGVREIQIEKSFKAEYLDPKNEEPLYSYSVKSTQVLKMPNLAQYKSHMTRESRIFFESPVNQTVVDYLSTFLKADELRVFKSEGLNKSNLLGVANARKLVTTDEREIPGIYADGAYRECRRFGEKFCLSE